MATTNTNRVGVIRIKLAALLEAEGFTVYPEDLNSQVPVYANPKWDCCSWYGRGKKGEADVSFASWDTMRECVRDGIFVWKDSGIGHSYEVCPKGREVSQQKEGL